MDVAELYGIISTIAFVVAAIFFIIAVVLFFAFDIPSVIGELSGKTAAKQVAEIRAANRSVVARRPVTTKTSEVKATQQRQTSNLQNTQFTKQPTIEETALLQEETALLQDETVMLSEATTLLDGGTTLLSPETTVLDEGTTLLSEYTNVNDDFVIIQNVVIVHTKERI